MIDNFQTDGCYLAGLVPAFTHIKRWSRPRDYFGAEWPECYSAGVGQSRDSKPDERSNFRVMLAELKRVGFAVTVVHERHWAVGWVEWIAINQADYAALAMADHHLARLEDYPLLDENDLSGLEEEEAADIWRECYTPLERIAYIDANRSQFEFDSFADLLGCVRGKYFAGYASELVYR